MTVFESFVICILSRSAAVQFMLAPLCAPPHLWLYKKRVRMFDQGSVFIKVLCKLIAVLTTFHQSCTAGEFTFLHGSSLNTD